MCCPSGSLLCVDREGFTGMVPALAPSEYLALADEMSAGTVRTMLDAGGLGHRECNDYDHMYSSPRQGRAYEEPRQE